MTTPLATPAPADTTAAQLAAFHARWHQVGGSERANYQLFITELCALLGVPLPDPARDDTRDNAYVFERRVTFAHGDGSQSHGFIDCYRRSAFVLEAKGIRHGAALAARGSKRLNLTMQEARALAESYARALPAAEGRPPLLLVVDVGHLIELFADFTRSGATYTPFPDVRSHRIPLGALCDAGPAGAALRARLRAAWLDPMSLDPSRVSARVTREVSSLLAELARSLEAAGHAPHSVAAFLSRCLFCMFAEDVELLPRGADGQGAFIGLLRSHAGQPARLVPMLRALWRQMDSGGFSERLGETLLRFNGKLFKGGDAPDYVLTLTRDQIELLQRAASADWREVEPAIFGTLLERALDPTERHALGAHYTPRAYVERLVLPAVIEPLRADWADAQAAALLLAREAAPLEGKKREAKLDEARLEIRRFHHQLCNTRVLDPACGSGNFLYVTLEHLKRLEAEVLDYLGTLGDTQAKLGLEGETVTLQQLRGIELNRRAATLAELVLWIGWLQWHIRSFGNRSVAEPVVHDYGNIECRDAVLAWDAREPALDATGQPVTRWDGKTFKPHPVTGELVPDDTAQTPQWRYVNPCRAEWPQADFIVGNPPFIGSKRMRSALGDGYVDALQQAWPEVPDASDFVMRWWHKAALQTRQGETRRFGFITSNSLRQIYVRRAVEPHLLGDDRLSILMAIPDHPWVDSADGAAVRIAMTVAEKGVTTGLLREVTAELETSGETEDTVVSMAERCGLIGPDLRVGANLASASPLQSHQGLCAVGMKTIGAAFQIDQPTAINLGLGTVAGLENHIRPYLNGRDFVSTPRNIWVIDFFGLDADEVRQRFPAAYQHLADRAKPERDLNRNEMFRRLWWIIGHPRQQFREATRGLSRYIVTVETAKHNIFAFLPTTVVPDSTLVTFAFEDAYFLGVLSSLSHIEWALAAGGRLGVGNDPRYNKTRCFETFPFPAEDTGLTPALAERIRVLAEQIDAHRKQRQAAHDTVTLTGLYNVLAKLRSGEALNAKDKVLHRDGLVSVLQSLHDELDAAVLQAYGWADLGAVPWADAAAREAWTEALLERLVALNTRRAAEEATGLIRWLRPSFQDPARRASAAPSTTQPISLDLPAPPDPDTAPADTEAPAHDATRPAPGATAKKPWPSDNKEQLRSVAALLAASPVALSEAQIAGHYTARGPWKKRLPDVLATLEAVARARCDGGLWRGV